MPRVKRLARKQNALLAGYPGLCRYFPRRYGATKITLSRQLTQRALHGLLPVYYQISSGVRTPLYSLVKQQTSDTKYVFHA